MVQAENKNQEVLIIARSRTFYFSIQNTKGEFWDEHLKEFHQNDDVFYTAFTHGTCLIISKREGFKVISGAEL